MATIQIQNLTFGYPEALDPLFQNVNLDLDTTWRLGLIGRNGKGKTTLLRLLLGEVKGQGSITSPEAFEYFPPRVEESGTALQVARRAIAPFDEWEAEMRALTQDATPQAMERYGDIEQAYSTADGYVINEIITAEAGRLGITPEVLSHPFQTLSGGERVKLLLAALFLKKHRFLLIDEPTDHLDIEGRRTVAKWLAGKQGFILVSHDRAFLDEAVDHILALNRAGIELQKGNYSSWRHNRTLQDEHEKAENCRLEASISHLEKAAKRTGRWSDKIEKTKIGGANRTDSADVDRGYIGHQAARMMQRSKAIQQRREKELEEKRTLLHNIEESEPLRLPALKPDKSTLVTAQGLALAFGERQLFSGLTFTIRPGQRLAVTGANGSGKSCLLKLVLGELQPTGGTLNRYGGLVISTLPQETNHLWGTLREFAAQHSLPEPLFLSILRKLDFEREAFAREVQTYSSGQKKKVCLAASLCTPAHLFVWDEPLNYIDILSREQIEAAALNTGAALLFVEHEAAFVKNVATETIHL